MFDKATKNRVVLSWSVEYLALENDLTCLVVIVQSEVILSA